MSVPPIHKQYAQFDRICTCGRSFGFFQREFEKRERELRSTGMSLSDTRKQICKEMGIIKLCCLREVTNYPMAFILDCGVNAYTNTTYSDRNENIKMGNLPNFVGEEFLPATRNVWGFDPNNYCAMIMSESTSDLEKFGLLMNLNNTENLQFCNFYSEKTMSFPIVFRSNIKPPENFI